MGDADTRIRAAISGYLAGHITLAELHRHTVALVASIPHPSPSACDIELILDEWHRGDRTESEVREELAPHVCPHPAR